MFRLPPFPLARLEAAVLPGPHSFELAPLELAPPAAEAAASVPEAMPIDQPDEQPKPEAEAPAGDGISKEGDDKDGQVEAGEKVEPADTPAKPPGKKGKRQGVRKARTRRSKGGNPQVSPARAALSDPCMICLHKLMDTEPCGVCFSLCMHHYPGCLQSCSLFVLPERCAGCYVSRTRSMLKLNSAHVVRTR